MYELSIISLIALCLVSFIGVPHGSFDGAVAALLGYESKKQFFSIAKEIIKLSKTSMSRRFSKKEKSSKANSVGVWSLR